MMSEIGLDLKDIANPPKVYSGSDVAGLGVEKMAEIAHKVSSRLDENQNTMIQYSPANLVKSMREGRAACILDANGDLTAFAQYWPYKVDFTGDDFMNGQRIYEVGTWLRFGENGPKNQGRQVFEACLQAGEKAHPSAGFIAIVEGGNERATSLMASMGGVEIGSKISKQVKATDESAARMKIFRVTTPKSK